MWQQQARGEGRAGKGRRGHFTCCSLTFRWCEGCTRGFFARQTEGFQQLATVAAQPPKWKLPTQPKYLARASKIYNNRFALLIFTLLNTTTRPPVADSLAAPTRVCVASELTRTAQCASHQKRT